MQPVDVTITAGAPRVNASIRQADPTPVAWYMSGDRSGNYTAQVREKPNRSSTLIGTVSIVGTFDPVAVRTLFVATVTDLLAAAPGNYWWDVQTAAGATLLSTARFTIRPDVTV